ncbi:hypothetical protein SASPL_138609 [Salvia splendens]|uniref:Pentatricopeptide repeat-containing protein n=1 Tax=Salvia splendens TaxID=180675 RepID=A0A8X8ZF76_SALSN|nr:hypothetical protein SASPL_138609 [Salvia splendens]
MYCQCNKVEAAEKVMQKMMDEFELDVYTWNGIVAGCVENGHHEMAMQLFSQLQSYGVLVTQNAMLNAYTKHGYGEEEIAFFNAYTKHGYGEEEIAFFNAYTKHGYGEEEIAFFKEMVAWNKTMEAEHPYGMVERMPMEADSVIWGTLLGGRWNKLREIRQRMKHEELHKTSGCNWIEDRDETHVFMA